MTTKTKSSLTSFRAQHFLKPVFFIVCLLPLVITVFAVAQDRLGANPVEAILQSSGEWALRFFLFALTVTPLQLQFKWLWIARLRRMLGLFAFFYASLHLLIWVALDQGLDINQALREVLNKPFILAGMLTVLGMLPLALTSNRFSVRKLGVRWKSLHNMVYLLAIMAMVHFIWQVKGKDLGEQMWYLAFLIGLLLWRLLRRIKA